MLGVSTVTLSRWERDHTYPTWDYHARLVEYLGCDAFAQTGLKDPYTNKSDGVAFLAGRVEGEIGQRIRRKRIESRLTVSECAGKLGVAVRTLRDWESGSHQPLRKMVNRIVDFIK